MFRTLTMIRISILFFALALCLKAESRPPNIVFIFIDDWAWNGTPIAFDEAMANSKCPCCRCSSQAACTRWHEVSQCLRLAAVFAFPRMCADWSILPAQWLHRVLECARAGLF